MSNGALTSVTPGETRRASIETSPNAAFLGEKRSRARRRRVSKRPSGVGDSATRVSASPRKRLSITVDFISKLSRSWRTVKRALVSVKVAARARVTHVRDARPDAGHARARVRAARNPVGVDGSPVMFRRKKSVSARAEETPPEDAPSDPADDASLWSDDSMTPERGVLTRGAVRGLPGDGSDGDASPSSRSLLSVDSAASTPSRARSVSTDRWRRDALEALSARMLNEETREARELAAREARHREEQDRKRAGVLASLPSALASRLRRSGRKPSSARSARGDGGSSADDASDLGGASAFAPHVSDDHEAASTRAPA